MTRNVRQATRADAPAIETVARESWHAAYASFLGEETVEEKLTEWYSAEDLERSIEEAATERDPVFLVVELDGRGSGETSVVGFAHAVPSPNQDSIASLARIYVHPDRWGKGLGRALLAEVERALSDRFEGLRLAVFADNEVGVRFYESTGFERVDTRPSDLGEDLEEYVYEKSL